MESEFCNARKQYNNFITENEQNYLFASNELHEIKTECDKMNENNLSNYERKIEKNKHFEEQFEKQISAVENEIKETVETVRKKIFNY